MRLLLMALILCWATTGWAQQGPDDGDDAEPEAAGEIEAAPAKAAKVVDAPNVNEVTGERAYQLKVTELESRVNTLKEKIFRSKTRLAILKESVLSSSIAGAEARLLHRNEMGSSFKLEKVSYSLDGTPVRSLVDRDGDLDDKEELEILSGPIVPGNHTISVVMTYRGNGYGIFSYLKGYVFTLRSSHTFRAEEGKFVQVKAIGYEKGGVTTDLKDRPDIRFEDRLTDTRNVAADPGGDETPPKDETGL
ncbi:MAG: hypothetical protein ACI9U2_000193 [Bradymonadia bacterium]|jgi:hypothetical protein